MREANNRRCLGYYAVLVVSFALSNGALAANNAASIAARVAKLERTLDSRGLVDLLQQLEGLQREVRRLRGQIEEQFHNAEQLRKTQRDTYVDMDQRLQVIEQHGGIAVSPPGIVVAPPLTTLIPRGTEPVAGIPAPQSSLQVETQSGTPGTGAMLGEPTTPPASEVMSSGSSMVVAAAVPSIAPRGVTIDNEESEAAYRDAFGLLKAGQYDESIASFSAFLQQYPSSQYADNAQYWLGETYYVKRQFEPAVVEYRKLLARYPESKKQSHAMLKIGYSFHELGQMDQARAVLQDLRNRYAGSTAARLAEERIQRIVAENPTL